MFKKEIEKIENIQTKTLLLEHLKNFSCNNEDNFFKFPLEKICKVSKADVQVYFDHNINKLYAIKKANLKKSKELVHEIISGYRINSIPNSEGFVKYDFFVGKNPNLENKNDEEFLNVVMDLCECSLLDYVIFLEQKMSAMDQQEKRDIFQNLFVIIQQIKNAVKNLHNSNLIHSDIKEANVLIMRNLNSNYVVKIADFETVLSFEDHLIYNGLLGGTASYYPKEIKIGQILSKTNFFKLDVFALRKIIKRFLKLKNYFSADQTNFCFRQSRKIAFQKNEESLIASWILRILSRLIKNLKTLLGKKTLI